MKKNLYLVRGPVRLTCSWVATGTLGDMHSQGKLPAKVVSLLVSPL